MRKFKRFINRYYRLFFLSVLISAVIFGIFKGVTAYTNYLDKTDEIKKEETQKEQDTKLNELKNSVEQAKCKSDDLRITLASGDHPFTYDEGMKLTAHYEYLGDAVCSLSTRLDNQYIVIASGPQTIYDSSRCDFSSAEDSGFLFAKGDSIDKEITWNLQRADNSGCAKGDFGAAGYYHAKLFFRDVQGLVSSDAVFQIGK